MFKDDLMKLTKEQLANKLIDALRENESLKIELKSKEFDANLHEDWQTTKNTLRITEESLEFQRNLNEKNQFIITELQELLQRYKSIVDKLGGNYGERNV